MYFLLPDMAVPGADSLVETWRFPFISHSKAWELVYLDLVLGTFDTHPYSNLPLQASLKFDQFSPVPIYLLTPPVSYIPHRP